MLEKVEVLRDLLADEEVVSAPRWATGSTGRSSVRAVDPALQQHVVSDQVVRCTMRFLSVQRVMSRTALALTVTTTSFFIVLRT